MWRFACTLAAAGMLAGQPAPPQQDSRAIEAGEAAEYSENDIIRVNTRLVEIDVVVLDSKGPVTGLTQDDFTVFDNGKRVPITAFTSRSSRVSTTQRVLPKGSVSNRLNERGEEPAEATIILWDVLNTEMSDQAWVQSQVLSYLRTLGPGDRVALYRLARQLRILQDFTADPDRLWQAAKGMLPEQSPHLQAATLTDQMGQVQPLLPVDADSDAGQIMTALVAEMNAAQTSAALEFDYFTTRDRALITLSALRAIAHHLHGIPGRKKLIWISGSFPAFSMQQNERLAHTQIESLNIGFQIDRAIEDLNESNVAVYPVDPRGLTTGIGAAAKDLDLASGRYGLTNPGIDTMNLLASRTGGRAFYSTNSVTEAIGRVFDDYDVTYTLGFRPTGSKLDRLYHKIDVKVNRKGVDVRHRRGYFDRDPRAMSERDRRNNMSLTMQNELDSTGVGLIAQTEPVEGQPGQYRVTLTIDTNDLTFRNIDGRWLSLIDYATYFSETPTLTGTSETLLVNLGEERYRETLQSGAEVWRIVDTGGQTGRLRIAIQDRTTGNVGSIWIPLDATTESSKTDSSPQ